MSSCTAGAAKSAVRFAGMLARLRAMHTTSDLSAVPLRNQFSTPGFSFIFRTHPRPLFSLYLQPFIGYWALQGWTPGAMGQHLPYRVLPPVSFAPLFPHPGAIAMAAGIWGLGSVGRGVIFRDGRAKFWESFGPCSLHVGSCGASGEGGGGGGRPGPGHFREIWARDFFAGRAGRVRGVVVSCVWCGRRRASVPEPHYF